MLAGVAGVGYQYLRRQGRARHFAQQLRQGLLGFGLGIGALGVALALSATFHPSNSLVNLLVGALPLLGLLIGFNHRIRYDW
jgi:hypothetical protein